MTSLSVIIPIYNKATYVGKCLETVIEQTLDDIEIICIDDGSTDGSSDVVRLYMEGHRNIKLLLKENTGVGDTRNIGISKSTGKYICFMDPDDYYPDRTVLKTLYDLAESNNVEICGGSFCSVRGNVTNTEYTYPFEGYKFTKSGIVKYSEYQFDYGFQRFIYKRDLIIRDNIRFPNYIRFQDPPFFISCMISAGCFYAVTMVTYCYRESYKKINWDLSKKIDNLCGMLDCVRLADINGLSLLKERIFARLTSDYYWDIIIRNSSRYECVVVSNCVKKIETYAPETSKYKDKLAKLCDELTKNLGEIVSTPAISVIIPIYNVENYIGPCLDSVLSQEFKDIQIICVDDGTEDSSAVICERYAKADSRITIIHRFNGGLSRARNTGADFAIGEYLYFLDSDDMLCDGSLLRMYQEMKNNRLDVLFFNAKTIFDSENARKSGGGFVNTYSNRMDSSAVMDGASLLKIMIDNNAYRSPVQLSIVSREFYVIRGLRCYPDILHEDNLYTLEVFVYATRAKYIAEELYIRRMRENSIMTSSKSFKNFYGYLKCYIEMNNIIQKCENPKIAKLVSSIKERNKRAAKVVFDGLCPAEKSKINGLSIQDRVSMALDPPFNTPAVWNCVPLVTLINASKGVKRYELHQSVWDLECVFVEESINTLEFEPLPQKICNVISRTKSKYVIIVNQKINSSTFVEDVIRALLDCAPRPLSPICNGSALVEIRNVCRSELLNPNLSITDLNDGRERLLFPLKWLKSKIIYIINKIERQS